MNLLKDKVAIVTGSSRGIGRAIVLKYSEHGAKIILNHTKEGKDIDETVSALKSNNADFLIYKGSVCDKDFVQTMVKDIIQQYGHIDILVNNAGIIRDRPLMLMQEKAWDEVINIHLKGAYLCSKAVLNSMIKNKGGRIINISSLTALAGREGQVNYGAAKSGLLGFTKSLAREVARYNILVNAVAAGLIDTVMTKKLPKDIMENLKNIIPLGRIGKPEEIANACLFLASDMSSYITGTTINVTGGGYM
jgi:3-oxoacyl-[acyl-carrier protein] reductase